MMNSALRMFLRELVDFDGLAPPSHLPTKDALERYLEERSSPQSWTLGRVVIPASMLSAVANHPLLKDIRLVSQGQPLPVSVRVESPDPRGDYAIIARYIYGERQPVAVRAIEVPISMQGSFDTGARVHSVVEKLAAAEIPYTIPVLLQMPPRARQFVGDLMDAIGHQRRGGRTMLCAMTQCAGEGSDVIEASDLAFFITTARRNDVPIKFGGVNVALRTLNAHGVIQHGALNVIGAAVLACEFDLDVQTITQMLLDSKAENFRLDHDHFAWKDYSLDRVRIFNARMTLVRSFSTPVLRSVVDGLTQLGILQTV